MSRSILKALSLGDNIFDLSPETSETIRRIKESIQDKTKIPPDRQRLTLGGIPPLTDDSKPIGDFCKGGETLHLSNSAKPSQNAGDNPAAQNPIDKRGDAGAQAHIESDDRDSGHQWDLTVTENTIHRQGDHINEGALCSKERRIYGLRHFGVAVFSETHPVAVEPSGKGTEYQGLRGHSNNCH